MNLFVELAGLRQEGGSDMNILLALHVSAGVLALLSAAVAIFSEKGKQVHLIAGSAYFWRMVGIFLTAMPMSLLTGNILLFQGGVLQKTEQG